MLKSLASVTSALVFEPKKISRATWNTSQNTLKSNHVYTFLHVFAFEAKNISQM